jgi:hypothetical protein
VIARLGYLQPCLFCCENSDVGFFTIKEYIENIKTKEVKDAAIKMCKNQFVFNAPDIESKFAFWSRGESECIR